jgi:hypothetical protein
MRLDTAGPRAVWTNTLFLPPKQRRGGLASVSAAGRAGAALSKKKTASRGLSRGGGLSRPDGTTLQMMVGSSSRCCHVVCPPVADALTGESRLDPSRNQDRREAVPPDNPANIPSLSVFRRTQSGARAPQRMIGPVRKMSGPTRSGPVASWSSLDRRPRVTATGAGGVSRPNTSGVVVSGADVP